MLENPLPPQESSEPESSGRKSGRQPLSRAEKRSFIAVGVVGLALVALPIWRHSINADPNVPIPPRVLPNPNAFDFYVSAANAQVAAKPAVDEMQDTVANLTPQERAIKYSLANKDAWLKRNAPALRTLREGFAFPYEEPSKGEKLFSSVPHGRFREMARTLIVESHARAEHGDWNGAAQSALDTLRLGTDIPRGADVMGALVGSAIQAIGRGPLWDATPHLNAAQAKAAGARLEQMYDTRVSFAQTMQQEKASEQAFLMNVMKGDSSWRGLGVNSLYDRIIMQTISKRAVILNYGHQMDAVIANAQLPYAAPHPDLPTPGDPFTAMEATSGKRTRWIVARDETLNALLFLSLELRAYKLEHGAYPPMLQQLMPAYLKSVPADPFGAGQALQYKRVGDHYLLYSIGPDGKDDGGRAIFDAQRVSRNKTLIMPDSQGDVVSDVNK